MSLLESARLTLAGLTLNFALASMLCAESQVREIKLGVIAPLTGQFAYVGDEIRKVSQLLDEELQASNSSYRYTFHFEDGKCGVGNSATTAAHKLLNLDKVKFLITGCSGETLQAGPMAQRIGALTFAVISNHRDIRKLGDYIYRTYVDAERGMERLVSYIRKAGDIPVAILSEDNAYTQGMKAILHEQLGVDIVFSDDYAPGLTDFRTLLLKAQAKNPHSFYFNCAGPTTCANLINQVRQLGIKQQLYSFVYTEHPDVLKAAQAKIDGVKYLAVPDIPDQSEAFEGFMRRYRERYSSDPQVDYLARSTYDALKAIIAGVDSVGPDASKVKDFLKSYRTKGALGSVSFDENGDVRDMHYVMKQIIDGRPQALGK